MRDAVRSEWEYGDWTGACCGCQGLQVHHYDGEFEFLSSGEVEADAVRVAQPEKMSKEKSNTLKALGAFPFPLGQVSLKADQERE